MHRGNLGSPEHRANRVGEDLLQSRSFQQWRLLLQHRPLLAEGMQYLLRMNLQQEDQSQQRREGTHRAPE